MNPDKKGALAGVLLALAILGLIYRITIEHRVYAPGAFQLQQYLAGPGALVPFMRTYAFGEFVYLAVRKFYGTVTFTLIAFCLSTVFARPIRVRNTVVVLTIMRAGLEVLERVLHRGDSLNESLFDTLTGTVAGFIGAIAYNALTKRAEVR